MSWELPHLINNALTMPFILDIVGSPGSEAMRMLKLRVHLSYIPLIIQDESTYYRERIVYCEVNGSYVKGLIRLVVAGGGWLVYLLPLMSSLVERITTSLPRVLRSVFFSFSTLLLSFSSSVISSAFSSCDAVMYDAS